ncbi:MAG: AraC family transcriptional regulator [Desulfobacteraceae bacterium]|nr:MAG: AraC family transcriptional regulator [Desulfobacteraceae bacterium]
MILFYEKKAETVRLVHGTQVTHRFPIHTHHTLIVGMVLRGQRTIVLRNKILWVQPGDLFVIRPDEPHFCCSDQPGGHDYWALSFSQKSNAHDLRVETAAYGIHTKVIRNPLLFQEALDLAALWVASPQSQRFLRDAGRFLNALFIDSMRPTGIADNAGIARYAPFPNPIQKIKIHIEQHTAEAMRMHDLARKCGLSPFYLTRLFREQIGLPPHAYLIQERIKQSQQLLKRGVAPVEAACETGFADQSHFNRFFKKHTGITPGQYADTVL